MATGRERERDDESDFGYRQAQVFTHVERSVGMETTELQLRSPKEMDSPQMEQWDCKPGAVENFGDLFADWGFSCQTGPWSPPEEGFNGDQKIEADKF
jgi:hypothetical protein